LHAHFTAEVKGTGRKFGSYMRTTVMEDAQGSYSHEEEFKGLHFSMGNVEIKSNGRRGRHEPVTMRSLHREVWRYRENNEKIMKAQQKILQSLNMLHWQVKQNSGTKQADIARQVIASRSHNRRDDHGNDRQSRFMSRCHHSPRKSNRSAHASLGLRSNTSVSPVKR
jgi:hypothetical protein